MSDLINQDSPVEQPVVQQEINDDTVYEIPEFGDVSLKELKEWKNGYMRQSDYTKKTQELAEQKRGIVNETVTKPSATKNDLERKVEKMHIEMELNKLKGKYEDFNEITVLDKAIELINKGNTPESIDFDMLYKATRTIDEDSIRQKILQEINAGLDTSSLIGNGVSNPPASQSVTLSLDEDRVRQRMGVSVEDWIRYK